MPTLPPFGCKFKYEVVLVALEVPCRVNEPLAEAEPLILGIIGVPLIIVCGVVWSKRSVVEVQGVPVTKVDCGISPNFPLLLYSK
jgi:hypothetical protein